MNKIILTIATVSISTHFFAQTQPADNLDQVSKDLEAYSQVANTYAKKVLLASPTTDAEYNYVINGLPNSIANSLDMKGGYSINGDKSLDNYSAKIYDYVEGNFQFNFSKLIRESDKSIAAIIIKIHSDNSGKTFYKCLPTTLATIETTTDIMDKFSADVKTWSLELQTAFISAYLKYTVDAILLENSFNNKLNDPAKAIEMLKNFNVTPEEAKKISALLMIK